MTRNEYEQRKQRLEEQRRESIELLEAFYRHQFRALEMVWMATSEEAGILPRPLAAEPAVQAPAAPEPEPAQRRRREPGELQEEVEAALASLPEVFDAPQVSQALGSEPERSSLFRVLKQLVRDGVLAVESRGRGKKPAQYRKTAPDVS
jgi:hypothetical protein